MLFVHSVYKKWYNIKEFYKYAKFEVSESFVNEESEQLFKSNTYRMHKCSKQELGENY